MKPFHEIILKRWSYCCVTILVVCGSSVLGCLEYRMSECWVITSKGNTGLVSCQPLVTTVCQPVNVFLWKTFCLICIVASLTLKTRPRALYDPCLKEAYLIVYFVFQKAHHRLFVLRNTTQHFSTMFGSHFKLQNYQQKGTKMQKMWH